MKTKILFKDNDELCARPLSRFKSIFQFRNGIYNSVERIRIQYPNSELYYNHPNPEYELSICNTEGYISNSIEKMIDTDFQEIVYSSELNPLNLLTSVADNIENDLKYLNPESFRNDSFSLIGSKRDLYIHKESIILPGVIFDTRQGPIIIDSHTEVSPHSYLCGPLYIGKNSKIDNLKISGGCVIGHHARLGGEIENTYINDYSNKHHEGFLGHSILGSWVNIGAMSTTSDLKNNYGEVKLSVPVSFMPSLTLSNQLKTVETGTNKFGSIIGDCSKIAIGTFINTGTIIDCGCNIFNGISDKYVPPFSWGDKNKKYELERFLSDSHLIFSRRNQIPHQEFRNMSNRLYESL